MSRPGIIWALVAAVIIAAILIFGLREFFGERSSGPGQPSPHAINQSS